MNYCSAWCGQDCVNGSCPMANFAEFQDRGYPLVYSCSECYEVKSCDSCIFEHSFDCPHDGVKDVKNDE